jgi:hypothetical protein
MSRKIIEQINREARTNDTVKIREDVFSQSTSAPLYSNRYKNRIGVVVRKSTDKKTKMKTCMVLFPNRTSELAIKSDDLIVVRVK